MLPSVTAAEIAKSIANGLAKLKADSADLADKRGETRNYGLANPCSLTAELRREPSCKEERRNVERSHGKNVHSLERLKC